MREGSQDNRGRILTGGWEVAEKPPLRKGLPTVLWVLWEMVGSLPGSLSV